MATTNKTADKRQAILRATLQLILKRGLQATPTSLIAKQAGVSVGNLYHHFPSKDALINTLYADTQQQLIEFTLQNYDASQSARHRHMHIWTQMALFALQHPDESSFVDQFAYSPVINEETLQHNALTDALLKLYQDGRGKVFKDMDPEMLQALSTGALNSLVKGHFHGRYRLDKGSITEAAAACWQAISQ